VALKLVLFSVLVLAAPIAVFLLLLHHWHTSTTVAGIGAAVAANFVLFLYILLAYLEDDEKEER